MTTTTRNEAAERLRKMDKDGSITHLLNKALNDEYDAGRAEGRRATVERIRAEWLKSQVPDSSEAFYKGVDAAATNLFAILDEEAAR